MSGAARRLIVLRHGQTEHNARGIWQGQYDSELADRGRAQAAAAAVALAGRGISRVITSDLRRAADTAAAVAAAAGGVPVVPDARLREIHAGQWTGMTTTQVTEQFPDERALLLRGADFRRGVDGETAAEVVARVRALATEVIGAMAPGECVLLATHGVTARLLVADLVGLPRELAWTVLGGLGNCRWAEVAEAPDVPGRWRLEAWNAGAG